MQDVYKRQVSGYGEEGVRVRFVTEDKVGVLEQIIHLIVEEGYNIANTVNIPTKDDRVVIEVQIDGVTDLEGILSLIHILISSKISKNKGQRFS